MSVRRAECCRVFLFFQAEDVIRYLVRSRGLGDVYKRQHLRDVDCDFRLMRREVFERVHLEADSGVICVELMKKTQDAGFQLTETPVHHFHRAYGKSQFFRFRRLAQVARDLTKLWYQLVWRKEAPTATCLLYTLRAHETVLDLVCRLLLEKKKSLLQ